jgi:hypothetical protein
MANTVVGIFEYEADGQNAQNYLLANGFADGNVDIKIATYKTEADASEAHHEDEDIFERIGHFFRDLFDGDEEETTRYAEAGRRGTIVTVHAATVEEAHQAAAILDEYGAVDVRGNDALRVDTEELRNEAVRTKSRIVGRPIQESFRLRQTEYFTDTERSRRSGLDL